MPNPTATTRAYLEALEDPTAGGAVWDLHAPGALLPAGGGLARKADLPREAYAAAFEADATMAARARPGRPRGPLIAGLRAVSNGDRLAWFAAEEGRTGEPLRIAVGFDPDGLIEWATLAPLDAQWTWETGRAQCYAEHPYGKGIYPRSFLDMAWQRTHGHARPPLLLLPEAAFACAGSTDCCRIDWAIEVDAGFQHVVDALPWGEQDAHLRGVQLPALPDGKLAVKDEGQTCRFLDAAGRCAVHRTLGRQIFPPCAIFPFAFAQTPDGLAFSTSARCGAARGGFGPKLSERLDDLYDRVAIAAYPPLRTPVYRLAAGVDAPWPAFKAAEQALLDALADETRPLATRLWRGALLLASAAAGGEPVPLVAAPAEPLPVPAAQREAVRAFLAPWLDHLGLRDAPVLVPAPADPADAAQLTRILRNLHHSKVLSFHFDLATSHAMGVGIWLLAAHLRQAHGRVPAAGWDALGVMFMHGAGLQAYLGDAPEARERRAMLGDPGFALWLTGYGV